VGDVDDAGHTKALSLIEWAKWFKFKQSSDDLDRLPDITSEANMKIYFWIDWPCVDQLNPGPDTATLPAFVACSHCFAAAWCDEYISRAWCQVELMIAYGFVTMGGTVMVVPEGFTFKHQKRYKDSDVVLPDPLVGNVTNPNDKAVIASLRSVAYNSSAFSCYLTFVNNSTQSVLFCIVCNGCCCCMWCGLLALIDARRVRPGASTIKKREIV
jgi:hypothetical protein